MNLKKVVRDYFEYYPGERRGLMAVAIIIFLWGAGLILYSRIPVPAERDLEFKTAVEKYQASQTASKIAADSIASVAKNAVKLFYFDPNTLSADSLKLLGIPERAVNSIVNYRSKGGEFRSADQLAKIYTLSAEDFERVAPFITIESVEQQNWKQQYEKFEKKEFAFSADSVGEQKQYKKPRILELNLADTLDLVEIYGIGNYLARKIVERRDALGGFLHINQLLEVYKVDNEVLDKIEPYLTIDSSLVNKININTTTTDELKKHPYIKYSLANSLVNYRKAHGPYRKHEDLMKSHLMNDSIFKLIRPYIKLND
jgi:DNA uptake protein ComE-like DNA-binding protein